MELLRRSFDSSKLPPQTKKAFDNFVKAQMKAPTFLEYLRLMSMEEIGDKKAMRILSDPHLNRDKMNFISPKAAATAKKKTSTLKELSLQQLPTMYQHHNSWAMKYLH